VKKASRADIARFLDEYVIGKPFVLGALVSPEMVDKNGLTQAHMEKISGAPPGKPQPRKKPAPAAKGGAPKKKGAKG
jgi:hypothetical protein